MAVRLNVVMNQSPPASAFAQRLGEAIVGEMIGRPGIDMVLINSSSLEDASSTDYLTLQSLSEDFVYLDWKSPDAAVSWLADCGIGGERFSHVGDPKAIPGDSTSRKGTQPQRRIYAFDLGRYKEGSEVCQAVYGLLALRKVRTFSLGAEPGSTRSRVPSVAEKTVTTIPPLVTRTTSTPAGLPPDDLARPPRPGLSDDQLDDLVGQLNDDELV